jgi:hypothetical protein
MGCIFRTRGSLNPATAVYLVSSCHSWMVVVGGDVCYSFFQLAQLFRVARLLGSFGWFSSFSWLGSFGWFTFPDVDSCS